MILVLQEIRGDLIDSSEADTGVKVVTEAEVNSLTGRGQQFDRGQGPRSDRGRGSGRSSFSDSQPRNQKDLNG